MNPIRNTEAGNYRTHAGMMGGMVGAGYAAVVGAQVLGVVLQFATLGLARFFFPNATRAFFITSYLMAILAVVCGFWWTDKHRLPIALFSIGLAIHACCLHSIGHNLKVWRAVDPLMAQGFGRSWGLTPLIIWPIAIVSTIALIPMLRSGFLSETSFLVTGVVIASVLFGLIPAFQYEKDLRNEKLEHFRLAILSKDKNHALVELSNDPRWWSSNGERVMKDYAKLLGAHNIYAPTKMFIVLGLILAALSQM